MTFSPAWSHTSPGTKLAAVANGGVLVESNGVTQWFNTASSVPVWSTAPVIALQPKIDAGGGTLATLRFEMATPISPRVPTLRCYTPASATPTFTYSFPFNVQSTASGVHVSRDGSVIAAWVFSYDTLRTVVNILSSNGVSRAQVAIQTHGLPFSSALSADASTLLIVSQIKRCRINTITGHVIEEYNITNIGLSCAIDGPNYAVAQAAEGCDVWRGATQSTINPVGTTRCVSVRLGTQAVTGWSDGLVIAGASQYTTPGPMIDMDISPDESTIACVAGGVTVLERAGAGYAQTFSASVPNATDVDVSNDLVAVTAQGRVDLFRKGAVPTNPTEYRATIPWPAVQGATHPAIAFPLGTGPNINVRVL